MAKILLVDDNPVLTKLYSTRLSLDNHEVEIANDGEEALTKLQTFDPQLIVLDLMMPKLNGFKFIEVLRTDSIHKNIPVIVFSSMADPKSSALTGVKKILNKIDTTPTQLVQYINETINMTSQ